MIALVRQLVDSVYFFIAKWLHLVGRRFSRKRIHKDHERYNRKNVWDIPGPGAVPVLGTGWNFLLGLESFNKMHEYYRSLYDRYGPIVKEEALFNVPVVHVFEKEDLEKVFRCVSKYPLRPPTEAVAYYRRSNPDRYASVGMINEQGTTWSKLRHALTPTLMSPKTVSNFIPQLNDISTDWCQLISSLRTKDGDVHNMEDIAGRLGLEISCALILGRRMGFASHHSESSIAKEFSQAVHEHFVAIRDTYFGLPLWKLFSTSAYRKLVENEEKIYKIASDLIKSADESVKRSPIFESILHADVDPREKNAAVIDFLAAGIHTLKNSLLFLLHLVAANKTIQEKIYHDENLDYVKACVMESYRYVPTACALARIIDQNIELRGYHLEAGSVLVCHTGIACRQEKNFKDANTYRPERWFGEEKSATMAGSSYILSPFGIGKRICPGKRFMEHVLPVLLKSVVKEFVISVEHPLEIEFEFLLSPKPPITINFQPRR